MIILVSISARTHIQFVTKHNAKQSRIRKANRNKRYLANLDKEKAKSIELYNADALTTKADMRDYSKTNYLVNSKKKYHKTPESKKAASKKNYTRNISVKKASMNTYHLRHKKIYLCTKEKNVCTFRA